MLGFLRHAHCVWLFVLSANATGLNRPLRISYFDRRHLSSWFKLSGLSRVFGLGGRRAIGPMQVGAQAHPAGLTGAAAGASHY